MEETTDKIKNLKRQDGHTIAYRQREPKNPSAPGVVFLSGFKSDMEGTKAVFLEGLCRTHGLGYVRFDYFGHGKSSGAFTDGTIGRWLEDVLAIIDGVTTGRQILIGSSMGGWLMLLAAMARPKRLHALIGIASAPDFTERLIWEQLKKEEQARLMKEGVFVLPSDYCNDPAGESAFPITLKLIEEGRRHLLLGKPLPIHCPVRLLHGMEDRDVPPEFSLKVLEKLESQDAAATFLKTGDHRMSSAPALALLEETLLKILELEDFNLN
jgi:pimeloyl-ACP methyl ester carboxylesterase